MKRADALRMEGRRRSLRVRWEDSVKIDLAGVGVKSDVGVETVGGDGSKTGSVTKKKENKNLRPASVPASPWTSGIKRRITTC